MIDEIADERPDLKGVFESVQVRAVPKGAMGPLAGWHHWRMDGRRPRTVEIFIESGHPKDITKKLLVHEGCHSKVMNLYPDIYPHLSEESKEAITDLCARGEL